MRKDFRGLALLITTVVCASGPYGAQAEVITQSASIPFTSTNFSPSSPGLAGVDPLNFAKFDTQGGTRELTSVTISMNATTQNQYEMNFITAGTIIATVATSNPSVPVPTITIFDPDGVTPALMLAETNNPAQFERTVSYGGGPGQHLPQEFSSSLPSTSPFYLAPANTSASSSVTMTDAADLAKFTGTGTMAMPVTAAALEAISVSSGNGSGVVTTTGSANVDIVYNYTLVQPQTIPEPAGLVLWGLAGTGVFAVGRWRKRAQA